MSSPDSAPQDDRLTVGVLLLTGLYIVFCAAVFVGGIHLLVLWGGGYGN